MNRKVGMSEKTAHELVALQDLAELRGIKSSFRRAWLIIKKALHERPLPPDESEGTFGELRYQTKHSPVHSVCIGASAPLAVRFAVCEELTEINGEMAIVVSILGFNLLS